MQLSHLLFHSHSYFSSAEHTEYDSAKTLTDIVTKEQQLIESVNISALQKENEFLVKKLSEHNVKICKSNEKLKKLEERLRDKSKKIQNLQEQLHYYKSKCKTSKIPTEPDLNVHAYIYTYYPNSNKIISSLRYIHNGEIEKKW